MDKDRKAMFEEGQFGNSNPDESYRLAYKQVKKIKGFYVHFLVYVLVNIFILVKKYFSKGADDFWDWDTFGMAFFWGIGIVSHGISVFGKKIFFGNDWEERKIQEIMAKEKENTNNWE